MHVDGRQVLALTRRAPSATMATHVMSQRLDGLIRGTAPPTRILLDLSLAHCLECFYRHCYDPKKRPMIAHIEKYIRTCKPLSDRLHYTRQIAQAFPESTKTSPLDREISNLLCILVPFAKQVRLLSCCPESSVSDDLHWRQRCLGRFDHRCNEMGVVSQRIA